MKRAPILVVLGVIGIGAWLAAADAPASSPAPAPAAAIAPSEAELALDVAELI